MKTLLPVLACLVLISCADPYRSARTTVMIGRGAVVMAQTGFDIYAETEKQKCTDRCGQDVACMTECMDPVVKKSQTFAKSKLVTTAGLDEADVLITVAEKLKKSEPVDWLVPIKGAACLLARSLDFLPKETKQKIQSLIDLMGDFGCKVP